MLLQTLKSKARFKFIQVISMLLLSYKNCNFFMILRYRHDTKFYTIKEALSFFRIQA